MWKYMPYVVKIHHNLNPKGQTNIYLVNVSIVKNIYFVRGIVFENFMHVGSTQYHWGMILIKPKVLNFMLFCLASSISK